MQAAEELVYFDVVRELDRVRDAERGGMLVSQLGPGESVLGSDDVSAGLIETRWCGASQAHAAGAAEAVQRRTRSASAAGDMRSARRYR